MNKGQKKGRDPVGPRHGALSQPVLGYEVQHHDQDFKPEHHKGCEQDERHYADNLPSRSLTRASEQEKGRSLTLPRARGLRPHTSIIPTYLHSL